MKTIYYLLKDKNHTRKLYFRESREEIASKNLRLVQSLSVVALILVLIFIAITPLFFHGWRVRWEYVGFVVLLIVFFVFARLYSKKKNINYYMVQFMCSAFCVLIMTGVIGIDVFPYPNSPSSFTQVVQIILPTVFILRFISIIPILAFSDIIYCILVIQYKNPSVQYGDIYNTLVGFLLGVVVAWIVMDLRVRDSIIKDQFQKMSSIDLLTGILNKRTCEENIAEYLKKRDECYRCALVVLDIDDFKHVNDRLGHHCGDVLLEGFGSLLTHTFRTSDIIGRIGGDEFMILMRNVTDYKILDYKYNQLQNGIKKLGELIGYTVTCSAGFAVAEKEKISLESMFEMADDALYEAKAFGKNRHIIHIMYEEIELQKDKQMILIADDSDRNRNILKEIFGFNYELVEATEGTAALSLLSQYKSRLAVILLDLQISGMDGFEILRYLNSRGCYIDIPVIVFSADDKGAEEALLLGATDIIHKPFDADVVKSKVECILTKRVL